MFKSLLGAFSSPDHKKIAIVQLAEAQKSLLQYKDIAEHAQHMTNYLQAKVVRLQNLVDGDAKKSEIV